MGEGKASDVLGRAANRSNPRLSYYVERGFRPVIIGAFIAKENKKKDHCLFSLISFCGGHVHLLLYPFFPLFLGKGKPFSPFSPFPLFRAVFAHLIRSSLVPPPPFLQHASFFTTRTCLSRNVQYFEFFYLKNNNFRTLV